VAGLKGDVLTGACCFAVACVLAHSLPSMSAPDPEQPSTFRGRVQIGVARQVSPREYEAFLSGLRLPGQIAPLDCRLRFWLNDPGPVAFELWADTEARPDSPDPWLVPRDPRAPRIMRTLHGTGGFDGHCGTDGDRGAFASGQVRLLKNDSGLELLLDLEAWRSDGDRLYREVLHLAAHATPLQNLAPQKREPHSDTARLALEALSKSPLPTLRASEADEQSGHLLRHEIQGHLYRALRIARFEHGLGLHATFCVDPSADYFALMSDAGFRVNPHTADVLLEIQGLGHEIALLDRSMQPAHFRSLPLSAYLSTQLAELRARGVRVHVAFPAAPGQALELGLTRLRSEQVKGRERLVSLSGGPVGR
jgi:hypothetical protein